MADLVVTISATPNRAGLNAVARLDSGPVREMRAVIERNGQQLGVTVPWTVSAATDTSRLEPYVNTLAASLVVLFLGGFAGWFVLRRRRAVPDLPDFAELELRR